MTNPIAIVTGAASGMGEASAIAMAEAGWPVLACDVNAERLAAAAEQLRNKVAGAEILTLSGDLTDPAFYEMLDKALAGRAIGALVHAAGLSSTMADAARIIAVNLGATITLLEFVKPRIAEGGAAVIICSTSAHLLGDRFDDRIGAVVTPQDAADLIDLAPTPAVGYSVSKRGVYLLVRNQALDFGRRGARIVSISPGVIDTPMGRQEETLHTMMKEIVENSPVRRRGQPSEVAAAAVFLCSPQASFITGSDLLVDGGEVASDRFRPGKQA